jgi:hypothetical protein
MGGATANMAGSQAGKAMGLQQIGSRPDASKDDFGSKLGRVAYDTMEAGGLKNADTAQSIHPLSAQGRPVPVATATSQPIPHTTRRAAPAPSNLFKSDANGNESVKTYSDYLMEAING